MQGIFSFIQRTSGEVALSGGSFCVSTMDSLSYSLVKVIIPQLRWYMQEIFSLYPEPVGRLAALLWLTKAALAGYTGWVSLRERKGVFL